MNYEESHQKVFPFDKTVGGMLDPETVEDKVQMNLIINNRAGIPHCPKDRWRPPFGEEAGGFKVLLDIFHGS
jgi:hypothetical protein